jgi:hypothetical protein
MGVVEGAIAGGALIGGIGSYFGGKAQRKAAEEAQESAAVASADANALQYEMYQQSREDLAPWREAGGRALSTLEGKINEGPGTFNPEAQPGYKFGYEEFVEKPSLRLASATGRLGSGRTSKELTRYASDYATTKYDNFLDNWYKSLTPYQSLAGVGQTSASQSANNALNTGNSMANNILQTGNTIGQAQLMGGQARASGYAGMASAANTAAENYLTWKLKK